MQYLFSPQGELAITQLMRLRVLLAFDFDGTLAPIVATPEEARIPPAMTKQLAALSAQHPVAIITGRKLSDVTHRLGFSPAYVVGNHGAEGLDWAPEGNAMQAMRERLHGQAKRLRDAGVRVEDKGLSLALHYRRARHHDTAQYAIQAIVADLPAGLSVFGGKCVVNIVFSAAPHKGHAAMALLAMSACDTLLFVGDDDNDEAVFRCAQPDWLTVRVGGPQAASSAHFFLNTVSEMEVLLARLQGA